MAAYGICKLRIWPVQVSFCSSAPESNTLLHTPTTSAGGLKNSSSYCPPHLRGLSSSSWLFLWSDGWRVWDSRSPSRRDTHASTTGFMWCSCHSCSHTAATSWPMGQICLQEPVILACIRLFLFHCRPPTLELSNTISKRLKDGWKRFLTSMAVHLVLEWTTAP